MTDYTSEFHGISSTEFRKIFSTTEYSEKIKEIDICLLNESALLLAADPDAAGFLSKKSTVTGWYQYWFSLKGSQLMYFERIGKRRGPLVGIINLFRSHVTSAKLSSRPLEMDIVDSQGKIFTLRTENESEMHFWLEKLKCAKYVIPPAKPFLGLPEGDIAKTEESTSINIEKIGTHIKVNHVLCIVHGIGAGADVFQRNVTSLHKGYKEIMEKIFPDFDFHLEFMAAHWKDSLLKLESHKKLFDIIPVLEEKNPIRDFVVDKMMDFIYYYTDERHRNYIQRTVVHQLNTQYTEFKKRHPDFRGGVSLFAHSLGSIICYDILAKNLVDDKLLLASEGLSFDFRVDNLIAVGSPLGQYINLSSGPAGQILKRPDKLPFRIINLFHPNDPIALRLEPIIQSSYTKLPPVMVPYWWTMDKHQSNLKWLGNLWTKPENSNDELVQCMPFIELEDKARLPRIDYSLQVVNAIEEVSMSYSAVKAHTDYWHSRDTMLFVTTLMIRNSWVFEEEESKSIKSLDLMKDLSTYGPETQKVLKTIRQELISAAPDTFGKIIKDVEKKALKMKQSLSNLATANHKAKDKNARKVIQESENESSKEGNEETTDHSGKESIKVKSTNNNKDSQKEIKEEIREEGKKKFKEANKILEISSAVNKTTLAGEFVNVKFQKADEKELDETTKKNRGTLKDDDLFVLDDAEVISMVLVDKCTHAAVSQYVFETLGLDFYKRTDRERISLLRSGFLIEHVSENDHIFQEMRRSDSLPGASLKKEAVKNSDVSKDSTVANQAMGWFRNWFGSLG